MLQSHVMMPYHQQVMRPQDEPPELRAVRVSPSTKTQSPKPKQWAFNPSFQHSVAGCHNGRCVNGPPKPSRHDCMRSCMSQALMGVPH